MQRFKKFFQDLNHVHLYTIFFFALLISLLGWKMYQDDIAFKGELDGLLNQDFTVQSCGDEFVFEGLFEQQTAFENCNVACGDVGECIVTSSNQTGTSGKYTCDCTGPGACGNVYSNTDLQKELCELECSGVGQKCIDIEEDYYDGDIGYACVCGGKNGFCGRMDIDKKDDADDRCPDDVIDLEGGGYGCVCNNEYCGVEAFEHANDCKDACEPLGGFCSNEDIQYYGGDAWSCNCGVDTACNMDFSEIDGGGSFDCSEQCSTGICIPDATGYAGYDYLCNCGLEDACGIIYDQASHCESQCGSDGTCVNIDNGGNLFDGDNWRCDCNSGSTQTCNDNIQNQGETGVDCGGPCPACDHGAGNTYFCDLDGDDYFDEYVVNPSPSGPGLHYDATDDVFSFCSASSCFNDVACTTLAIPNDCQDDPDNVYSDNIHPGMTEVCDNGLDDNCDGFIDEGCGSTGLSCTTANTLFGDVGVGTNNSSEETACLSEYINEQYTAVMYAGASCFACATNLYKYFDQGIIDIFNDPDSKCDFVTVLSPSYSNGSLLAREENLHDNANNNTSSSTYFEDDRIDFILDHSKPLKNNSTYVDNFDAWFNINDPFSKTQYKLIGSNGDIKIGDLTDAGIYENFEDLCLPSAGSTTGLTCNPVTGDCTTPCDDVSEPGCYKDSPNPIEVCNAACDPISLPCDNQGGDQDNDGVCSFVDNCPTISNADQADADGNGTGDACEGGLSTYCGSAPTGNVHICNGSATTPNQTYQLVTSCIGAGSCTYCTEEDGNGLCGDQNIGSDLCEAHMGGPFRGSSDPALKVPDKLSNIVRPTSDYLLLATYSTSSCLPCKTEAPILNNSSLLSWIQGSNCDLGILTTDMQDFESTYASYNPSVDVSNLTPFLTEMERESDKSTIFEALGFNNSIAWSDYGIVGRDGTKQFFRDPQQFLEYIQDNNICEVCPGNSGGGNGGSNIQCASNACSSNLPENAGYNLTWAGSCAACLAGGVECFDEQDIEGNCCAANENRGIDGLCAEMNTYQCIDGSILENYAGLECDITLTNRGPCNQQLDEGEYCCWNPDEILNNESSYCASLDGSTAGGGTGGDAGQCPAGTDNAGSPTNYPGTTCLVSGVVGKRSADGCDCEATGGTTGSTTGGTDGTAPSYSWNSGMRSICSAQCNGGSQSRNVICVDQNNQTVADTNCTETKPITLQVCNSQACSGGTTGGTTGGSSGGGDTGGGGSASCSTESVAFASNASTCNENDNVLLQELQQICEQKGFSYSSHTITLSCRGEVGSRDGSGGSSFLTLDTEVLRKCSAICSGNECCSSLCQKNISDSVAIDQNNPCGSFCNGDAQCETACQNGSCDGGSTSGDLGQTGSIVGVSGTVTCCQQQKQVVCSNACTGKGTLPSNASWVNASQSSCDTCRWICDTGYAESQGSCLAVAGYTREKTDFNACSKQCGGGTQTATWACVNNDKQIVSDALCTSEKPDDTLQNCNTQSCTTCEAGTRRDCGESNIGLCRTGSELCIDGVRSGTCENSTGPTREVCDSLDNDCDGTIDEGNICAICEQGEEKLCGSNLGQCRKGTQRCVGGSWTSCTGIVGAVDEICDGLDNNCNGSVDEGCVGGGGGSSGGGDNYCGDGNLSLSRGEECDDGNYLDGDGCSRNCRLEGDAALPNDPTPADTIETTLKKALKKLRMSCRYDDAEYHDIRFRDVEWSDVGDPADILRTYCIVKGYDKTNRDRFHNDAATGMGEFIKVLTKIYAMEHDIHFDEYAVYNGDISYFDVSERKWYAPYIGYAQRQGLLEDVGTKLGVVKILKPAAPIAKDQAEKILKNAGIDDDYRFMMGFGRYYKRKDMAKTMVTAFGETFADYTYVFGNNIDTYAGLLHKLKGKTDAQQRDYIKGFILELDKLDKEMMGSKYLMHVDGAIEFLGRVLRGDFELDENEDVKSSTQLDNEYDFLRDIFNLD